MFIFCTEVLLLQCLRQIVHETSCWNGGEVIELRRDSLILNIGAFSAELQLYLEVVASCLGHMFETC